MLEESKPIKFPSGVQQLEQFIETLEMSQITYDREGKYQSAQASKLAVAEGKKLLENRKLKEMNHRHLQQRNQLENAHNQQLKQFTLFWDQKEAQLVADGKKTRAQFEVKHDQERRKALRNLDETLPSRIKQSVQLLNLRKMQQHMSKQKRYMDAHQVQARIAELVKSQTYQWQRQRNIKIDTKVSQLRTKQDLQLQALEKKIATSLDQLNVNRIRQAEILKLKYVNIKQDQRSTRQKQQLSFKGEFKSKTSISTSGSRSRN